MNYDKYPKHRETLQDNLEMFYDFMQENRLETLIVKEVDRGLQLALTNVLNRFDTFEKFRSFMVGGKVSDDIGGDVHTVKGFAWEYLNRYVECSGLKDIYPQKVIEKDGRIIDVIPARKVMVVYINRRFRKTDDD